MSRRKRRSSKKNLLVSFSNPGPLLYPISPTDLHSPDLQPCSQAILQIYNRGLVLRRHYSILSTKACLQNEVTIPVDTQRAKDEFYEGSQPKRTTLSLSMHFGSYQRDTSTCALSKCEAWVTAPASMEWTVGYRD